MYYLLYSHLLCCFHTDHNTRSRREGQGPHLREQDLVRTIRDTGERERGAHRDTEGGWAGFTHTTGSQGFPSRIGQSCTRRHGGRRGPPTGCALLVLLLLTRDSDRFAARWTPYSTGDLSRLATFLRLLTGSLFYHRQTDTWVAVAVIGVSHSVGLARSATPARVLALEGEGAVCVHV